jgi:hypothetical protein
MGDRFPVFDLGGGKEFHLTAEGGEFFDQALAASLQDDPFDLKIQAFADLAYGWLPVIAVVRTRRVAEGLNAPWTKEVAWRLSRGSRGIHQAVHGCP